jgi:hypothetical protein
MPGHGTYCMNPGKPLYFLHGTSPLFFPFPFPLVPAATRKTVAAPRALTISPLPNVLPPRNLSLDSVS